MADNTPDHEADIPVIPLKEAAGERTTWGRPAWVVYLWTLVEWLLVTNAHQPSSRLRVWAHRAFGATVGDGVIFRPRTRVKIPWKLRIGADSWTGEGVWIHNQDQVTIGHDAVISQETFTTTGSHAHRRDMALITRPVVIAPGAWITARCVVVGGAVVGRNAVAHPLTVVRGGVEANTVAGGPVDGAVRFEG